MTKASSNTATETLELLAVLSMLGLIFCFISTILLTGFFMLCANTPQYGDHNLTRTLAYEMLKHGAALGNLLKFSYSG